MKVLTLFYAYYLQLTVYPLAALILSHPRRVKPIAYIKIVVDCILVEPASAIYPTLQFIFIILSDSMKSFDL
jgi:hypothetical protein